MLCISHNPRRSIKRIQEVFKLKDHKIEPLDVYLGEKLYKIKLESGKYFCTMSLEQYVKLAVKNVEEDLARSGNRFPLKYVTPLLINYAPWKEDLTDLMADGVKRYQKLIGQIIWAVDIVRLDIMLEVSLLLSYLVMPQVMHLD